MDSKTARPKQHLHRCHLCPYSSDRVDNVRRHAMYRHSTLRDWACQVCPRKFVTKRDLKVHMSYHTGLKPFVCPGCGAAFRRACALTLHLQRASDAAAAVDTDKPIKKPVGRPRAAGCPGANIVSDPVKRRRLADSDADPVAEFVGEPGAGSRNRESLIPKTGLPVMGSSSPVPEAHGHDWAPRFDEPATDIVLPVFVEPRLGTSAVECTDFLDVVLPAPNTRKGYL